MILAHFGMPDPSAVPPPVKKPLAAALTTPLLVPRGVTR